MIGRQHLEVEMENEPAADIDPLESEEWVDAINSVLETCLLYTSPSPLDVE